MTLKLDPENPLATKVQTRDGRKARIICVNFKRRSGETILASHDDGDGFEIECPYYPDGRFFEGKDFSYDLINIPETRSWYVPVLGKNELSAPCQDKHGAAQSARVYGGNSVIEIRMCGDKFVEAIQHEAET